MNFAGLKRPLAAMLITLAVFGSIVAIVQVISAQGEPDIDERDHCFFFGPLDLSAYPGSAYRGPADAAAYTSPIL